MPTVEILCHQDTTAYSSSPSSPHNGANVIYGYYTSSGYAEAFLKTSLERWREQIPAGAQIDSATLMLYGSWIYDGTSDPVEVYENSGNWTADGLTWNSRPGRGLQLADAWTVRNGVWNSLNVTDWARQGQSDPAVLDRGLRVTPNYSSSSYGGAGFYSIESSESNDNPRFQVTYSSGGPTLGTATPNSTTNAIVINGTNASGSQRVEVHYANSSSGPYGFLGNATLSGDSWSLSDTSNAPPPVAPNLLVTPTSGTINLAWTAPSRPALVRYYKARKVLLDGTTSTLTSSYLTGTLTPTVNRYILQRKRTTETSWSTLQDGTQTAYTDASVSAGINYQYRLQAINTQGVASGYSVKDTTVAAPPAPTFDRIEATSDGADYILIGTNALSGATLNIYYSTQTALGYQKLRSEPTPTSGSTMPDWRIITRLSGNNPERPTFLTPTRSEGTLTLHWGTPSNPGSTAYFRMSQTVGGVEGEQSATRQATIVPAVDNYRLERKLQGQSDTQYQVIFDFDSPQSNSLSHPDASVQMGAVYIYRLSAKNSQGGVSPTALLTVEAPLPNPPTYLASTILKPQPLRVITNGDGTYSLRFAGAGRNGATSVIIQRLDGGLWRTIKTITGGDFVTTVDGEEWVYVDTPPTPPPNVVIFQSVSVDTDGVHLRWLRPENTPSTYQYRAIRVRSGLEGIPSTPAGAALVPTIARYRLQRRETPPANLILNPQDPLHTRYIWTTIRDANTLSHDDTTALLSRRYEYRIVAVNNQGQEGQPSAVQTVTTVDPPPPPAPPEEPPRPVISNPRPRAVVDIGGGGSTIRLAWDYRDPANSPQAAYKLRVSWTKNNVLRERWWNGTAWVEKAPGDPEPVVISDRHYVDVSKNILELGPDYLFNLRVLSGASGIYVETYNRLVEPDLAIEDFYTPPLTWTISAASYYTVLFDTRRPVTRTFVQEFDLYRKVVSYDPQSGPSMLVSWDVEEELPLEVNDETWEGGSNSWLWTVFDRDGRPEPYAELHFVKPETGVTTIFKGDDRGRFNLKIPDDITPGIYNLREIGPSMAPRNTRNFPVVDPSIVLRHAHRHAADGDDPIFGITSAQIAENANIRASQIEGGSALGELVDRFGPDLVRGIERHVTSGHGNYVVSGLTPAYNLSNRELAVTAGTAWEDHSLKAVPDRRIALTQNGTWKIYVLNGVITGEIRADHPPNTTPICSIVVTDVAGTLTDERLYHPTSPTIAEVTPVRWGASKTEDITHRGTPLSETLDFRTHQLDDYYRKEAAEKRALNLSNQRTLDAIGAEQIERNRTRMTSLALALTASLKALYALFRRRRAQVALAEAEFPLTQANATTALAYLQSMGESGGSPRTRNISAFESTDELSDLTTVIVRNGLATLPQGWVRGLRYIMRTLRVALPPSKVMEFHLVYEDTGALFRPTGSLSSSGRYLPVPMVDVNTVRDDSLKTLFGTSNNVYIKTFRCEGDGDEGIVELGILGGTHIDGVRLRGWAITGA